MISNNFHLSDILKIVFFMLLLTHCVFAVYDEIDIQAPDYNTIFDNSFLNVISTIEHDIIQWINVKDKNSINYSLISPDDVELLSKACEDDYICRQKKINSLSNLKRILESLECFHVFLSLQILNVFKSDIRKWKEHSNHKFILIYKYVRDYAIKMISFFIYGKYIVNSWQFNFSMNVINMVSLEKDKNKSFEDILDYINDPLLLKSMNEFCENCKRSDQFFASFTSVLTIDNPKILSRFKISDSVKSYMRKILLKISIPCAIKLSKIAHFLIKKANQQKKEIDPDFEKKKYDFLNSIKLNKLEIETYEKNTVSGGSWHTEEKIQGKRLKASYFFQACKINPTTPGERILKKITHNNKKNEVIIIENNLHNKNYGIYYEKVAINEFENKMNIKIEPCGVFIDENLNYLVASPDGLIGKDGIVEVKCPFNAKYMPPEDAIKRYIIKYLYINNNGNLIIKPQSDCFYQIQGELHITKRQYCYLIIWTQKGMLYTKIDRDDEFWKNNMENQLIDFYINRLLPVLISPQLLIKN
ncbi:uncharacterized protein LOC126893863 [Daktulosphaira vitifoliae]|uniref:uncharacterized protein LOC126893863 n=1 Tax=Daktulosphaira vitifoliae TaxID=58002 RepID=UPI0021AAD530|nr:uncharacterized protein LOC126893863 [Daktulosphaira vitifoliae]